MHVNDIPTPAMLIDLDILTANIEAMSRKANQLGVRLRPHIKTHKCFHIARMQMEHGAAGITVSTLAEAEAFAAEGFSDITYAVVLEPGKTARAVELAQSITLSLTLDNLDAAQYLQEAAHAAGLNIPVWLKVDAGYHRTGIDPRSAEAVDLAKFLQAAAGLDFAGLLSHAGHAYYAKSTTEIRFIVGDEQRVMGAFGERLAKQGIPVPAVSIGSTPSLAFTTELHGIHEIRPGNYVFHDRTQLLLGSCQLPDCAARILTSIISMQPGAGHAVIDAGALALSHDPGPTHLGVPPSRGAIFDLGGQQLDPSLMVDAVSQEHGFVRGQSPADVEPLKIGERLEVLPNHSCLAAPLFDTYYIVRGDDVIEQWPVMRRR